jgi:hypothetical protein
VKKAFTYLLCFTYLVGYSQTYSTVIPDKTISGFLTEYRTGKKVKKVNSRIREWNMSEVFDTAWAKYPAFKHSAWANDSVKKLFTKADSIFIRQQLEGLIITNWKSNDWQGVELLDSTQMKKVYANGLHGRRKKMDVYAFSAPLFSADYQYVIIQEYYTCGFMCSSWCYHLYRKTPQNTWVEITNWWCMAT